MQARFPGAGSVRASSTPSGERLISASVSVVSCDARADELVVWTILADDGLAAHARIDGRLRNATARMDAEGYLRAQRYDGCDPPGQSDPISDVSGTVDVWAAVEWRGRGPIDTTNALQFTRAASAQGVVRVGAPVSRVVRLPRTGDASFAAFDAIEE